jgi:hypothetical protein
MPEAQRHRAKLVNDSPPELAGSAFPILQATDAITLANVRAAHQYTCLPSILFGIAGPSVASDLPSPRPRAGDRTRSRSGSARLTRPWPRDRATTSRLRPTRTVVNDALPGWSIRMKRQQPLRPADEAERQRLLEALDRLAGPLGLVLGRDRKAQPPVLSHTRISRGPGADTGDGRRKMSTRGGAGAGCEGS